MVAQRGRGAGEREPIRGSASKRLLLSRNQGGVTQTLRLPRQGRRRQLADLSGGPLDRGSACPLLLRRVSPAVRATLSLLAERMILFMRFYAFRITCESCKKAFLVGGAAKNDLVALEDSSVECPKCGTACRARDGQVVDLTSQRCEIDASQLEGELTPV
jgi:hypothetical protein